MCGDAVGAVEACDHAPARIGCAICIFDAESAADVTAVNQQAGVPATDVIEAIDLCAAT